MGESQKKVVVNGQKMGMTIGNGWIIIIDYLMVIFQNIKIYSYWLVVDLPLWKMMEFVSWDDDIPNWMESHKSNVPNHQPVSKSIKTLLV